MLARPASRESVAATWVRWNREIFADLSGLLLGGPAVVGSLMDVIGRGARDGADVLAPTARIRRRTCAP